MPTDITRLIKRLNLTPHPEGGFYRETYRSPISVEHPGIPSIENQPHTRRAGTAIYFLLPASDFSSFHRVTCTDELWHLYSGDPLELHLIHANGAYETRRLTTNLEEGEPTALVEAGCWQAACVAPGGAWSFGGCTLAPGFDFADFEMPGASDLAAQFPQHDALIRRLTKRP